MAMIFQRLVIFSVVRASQFGQPALCRLCAFHFLQQRKSHTTVADNIYQHIIPTSAKGHRIG